MRQRLYRIMTSLSPQETHSKATSFPHICGDDVGMMWEWCGNDTCKVPTGLAFGMPKPGWDFSGTRSRTEYKQGQVLYYFFYYFKRAVR